MLNAIREGGWGMYPTLVFGLIALGSALRFAIRADPRLLGFVLTMNKAVLCFCATGFVTGLIATGNYVESHGLEGSQAMLTALEGFTESTNNLALGLTIASLVYLAVAVGRRRHDARLPLETVSTTLP